MLMLLLAMSSTGVLAQSNDNEDAVVKIEQHNQNAFREGEIIVKIKPSSVARANVRGGAISSGVNAFDAVMNELGVTECEELMPMTGAQHSSMRVQTFNGRGMTIPDTEKTYLMKFDSNKVQSVEQAIEKVQAIDDVEFAEPNYLVYALGNDEPTVSSIWNDPLGEQQWGLEALKLPKMHGKPNVTTKRPVIAILDTGIDIDHPDLKDNIWTNPYEANGASKADDDDNGFVDDIHGWDFVNQTARIRDNNGHGTHCAGIAAAVANNGKGMVGANNDAYIMPVTVMQSDGTGDIATIIKGLDYACANGADIISMSLGTYSHSQAFEQALGKAYATSILVAAAGNDGHTIETSGHCISCASGGTPCFPAAYTFVFGVESSTNPQGSLAGYSNWDNTGHVFSGWGEDKLYNYELRAPGSNILSTYLGGKYKSLNGTSMACPFAAGAISRLLQVKEYTNKEILFGDLIHASGNGNLDILATYFIKDEDRKPTLELISYTIDDSEFGDGDGRLDAGEIVDIYPIVRNFWGLASNIVCSIALAENEDPDIVKIINNNVDFGWELDGYAKNKSANPLRIKINESCANNRHICLAISATCPNNLSDDKSRKDVVMIAENAVEIGGVLQGNNTLHPGVNYVVTSTLAIPQGDTLTIEPGTIIKFRDGTSFRCDGKLIANGSPDKRIYITAEIQYSSSIKAFHFSYRDTIRYVEFKGFNTDGETWIFKDGVFYDCIFKEITCGDVLFGSGTRLYKCNLYEVDDRNIGIQGNYISCNFINSNYHCSSTTLVDDNSNVDRFTNCNMLSNSINTQINCSSYYYKKNVFALKQEQPNYYGSANKGILRKNIVDMNHPTYSVGFGIVDLDYVLSQPSAEAHGIVWKVVVNGYDAQDEYDQLPPLGVGRHKFEVYFNRAMDKTVAPVISMGVRKPYTQAAIAEDGAWNDEGTIYTAYLTITGKTRSDGVNRIYVYGAQDDEYFEIPEEYSRFNVNVQAAGSMATGLVAEAGLGKVTLNWETSETSFDDLLGFNVYRFDYSNNDTIKVNETLIEPGEIVDSKMQQSFIDYNVIPGTTYYYIVKEMSTDLSQNVVSNPVACTPLTASKGDANGSMKVDVADVVTEINYLTGQNPQPFIFDAADVNSDGTINILDVVGTVNIITTPNSQSLTVDNTAVFTVEDGILYVESPVALGGVQVTIHAEKGTEFKTLAGLTEMERADAWIADDKYMLLAYSMSGKSIGTGKQALLEIGDAEISSLVASDMAGRNVLAFNGMVTTIEEMPFGFEDFAGAETRYFDVTGNQISESDAMTRRLVIVRLYIDGNCVKTYKRLNK